MTVQLIFVACMAESELSPRQDGGCRRQYSRDFLLSRRFVSIANKVTTGIDPITDELRETLNTFTAHMQQTNTHRHNNKRRRGKKGGLRRKLHRKTKKPPLPTIVLTNAQSLRSKIDELRLRIQFKKDYRDACVICVTETWLNEDITSDTLTLPGFHGPYRVDRDLVEVDKKCGGGIAIYVNKQYCPATAVTLRDKVCTKDVELLSITLRPYYLPREFGQVFVTVVYTAPCVNVNTAADVISNITHAHENKAPDDPKLILGDFNKCRLKDTLPNYHQYVMCTTHNKGNTLDLCYGNIRDAYKVSCDAGLGRSDHYTLHLLPRYKSQLRRAPVLLKQVQMWSPEAVEALQGALACTDFSVFQEGHTLDESVAVTSDYIKFCEEICVPTKTVKSYPNNKPWLSTELRSLVSQRLEEFNKGNKIGAREIQRKLNSRIREVKDDQRKKIESQFASGDLRKAWKGLKELQGIQQDKSEGSGRGGDTSLEKRVDELNNFYCRFDDKDFSGEIKRVQEEVQNLSRCADVDRLIFTEDEVKRALVNTNPRKAPGPDGIKGRVLQTCASELCSVLCTFFNRSIAEGKVPDGWKFSIIRPVPKHAKASALNDFRPIALTSLIAKCMERLVLARLKLQVTPTADPLQFAYRAGRSTDDAIITLLQNSISHLEKAGSYVRILFLDFSSAFNCMQPHILARKLLDFSVHPDLIRWILEFLLKRGQCVRVGSTTSATRHISTGAPQGTVTAPLLFTTYTDQLRGPDDLAPAIKFADDTALPDTSNSESHFQGAADRIEKWCDDHHLVLNVSKTKELVIDFRRKGEQVAPVTMKGEKVERVHSYKYLGVHIDDKLTFSDHTHTVNKKCQQRLYLLRKLSRLHVNTDILHTYYLCHIESILTYAFMAWFGGLAENERKKLARTVNIGSKLCGGGDCKQLTKLYDERVVRKAKRIVRDPTHALHQYFTLLPSGRRFCALDGKKNRTRNTFVYKAIQLLNKLK